jgi:hypothetical protein
MQKPQFLRLAAWLLIMSFIVFLAGPSGIRAAYRRSTSQKEKEERKQRYQYLANAELSMPEPARAQSVAERTRLFYWFHSRGWPIDEGHEGSSTLNDWRELFEYWRQNESRG